MEIKSGKLKIRNATARDVKVLTRWWKDGRVMAHAGFPDGLGTTGENVTALLNQDDDLNHRLILKFENTPVREMNVRNRGEKVTEIGIKICDSRYQDKGYGTEYLKLLMGYIFIGLEYDRNLLDTSIKNERAQHVYEKLGFLEVSTRIDSWKDQVGQFQSSVNYEISKAEFVSLYCD